MKLKLWGFVNVQVLCILKLNKISLCNCERHSFFCATSDIIWANILQLTFVPKWYQLNSLKFNLLDCTEASLDSFHIHNLTFLKRKTSSALSLLFHLIGFEIPNMIFETLPLRNDYYAAQFLKSLHKFQLLISGYSFKKAIMGWAGPHLGCQKSAE